MRRHLWAFGTSMAMTAKARVGTSHNPSEVSRVGDRVGSLSSQFFFFYSTLGFCCVIETGQSLHSSFHLFSLNVFYSSSLMLIAYNKSKC